MTRLTLVVLLFVDPELRARAIRQTVVWPGTERSPSFTQVGTGS
jgi:hypothetical protein